MSPDPATTVQPADRDTLYARNMRALFRADMRLAQRIDECMDDGSVIVEPSRRGPPTAAIRPAGAERSIHLHSRVDPQAEARRWAEAVEVGENFCHVIGGFGLGHHVRELARRLKGDAFLMVTEPSLPLLRAAMEHVDLAELFENNRCVILTQADKGEIQTRLEPHSTLMMIGAQFLTHGPSEQAAGSFHTAMRKIIADHMTYCRMSLVTLVANSRITCRNVANNFPTYLSTPPINILRDRFKGVPAILVAAGPSLQRQIDRLADLRDRAVIIAVQTTFKTLLDRGIRPHFVTSLDYHEMSRRFFEDIPDSSHTHLVAEPKATWHVLDHYRGPTSVLYNRFAEFVLGSALAARDGLKAGATVAHLSLYLAVYMGCEPIVLLGQDLAYTNHVYYAPGVPIHDLWRPQLNRFCTIEMMEWERIVRCRPILMKVKDIHGDDIYTDEQLFTYLQQFEGDFAAIGGRVIDATGGGVRKTGTQVMSLEDVARQYCREPIPAEKLAYLQRADWNDPSRLRTGRREVEARLGEIDRMVETCTSMKNLLERMTGMLDRPAEFNRRIAEVDALRLEVHRQDRAYHLISAVSQQAELQRFSADRKLKLAETEGVELARRQLERDRKFVEAIIEGADVLKEILQGSLDRLDEAIARAGV
ncbi:MAG TPA: 6-hydroxymethylpterin diphosphokinase MptE-like protein [Phycisphaerae bacterium]|nr:6-hydroxymethylpterin diphosphokinase MptE-like protein [Phycisphaerae bacterium]